MGVSATVTKSNLFSQAFTNLFNLINDRSNIPDPLGNISRKLVYTDEPDVKARGFENYPFIIIYPINVDISEENKSLDNKDAEVSKEFKMEIRSSNRMPGKHNGNGKQYLDALSDSLYSTLNSEANQLTLRIYYMSKLNLNTDDTDKTVVDGGEIFVRRFTLSFNTRMAVSS